MVIFYKKDLYFPLLFVFSQCVFLSVSNVLIVFQWLKLQTSNQIQQHNNLKNCHIIQFIFYRLHCKIKRKLKRRTSHTTSTELNHSHFSSIPVLRSNFNLDSIHFSQELLLCVRGSFKDISLDTTI